MPFCAFMASANSRDTAGSAGDPGHGGESGLAHLFSRPPRSGAKATSFVGLFTPEEPDPSSAIRTQFRQAPL
ncbi:MAG TPA: hypothetical protein VGN34_09220, partial [Ktedonobacteraceae bacterium]